MDLWNDSFSQMQPRRPSKFCYNTSEEVLLTDCETISYFSFSPRSTTTTTMTVQRAMFATTVMMAVVVSVNASSSSSLAQQPQAQYHHHRNRLLQLFEKNDHNQMMALKNLPQEINVDAKLTYNDKFMPMMTSSCRPEVDGFFGATSGEPLRIQYGFQIETEPLSQVRNILDFIEDRIVDSILINTFPIMCGPHRRHRRHLQVEEEHHNGLSVVNENGIVGHDNNQQRSLAHVDSHPSGFRFVKFEEVGKYSSTHGWWEV
jgi:hypothetical protein